MKISTTAVAAAFTLVVIVASTLFLIPSVAFADEPETVEVTFGIFVDVDSPLLRDDNEDGIPDLPDLTGEDAVGVLIGGDDYAGQLITIQFTSSSPPCGDFPVAGTSWDLHSTAKIILKGGRPIEGEVWRYSSPPPPFHTFLRATKITSAQACWARNISSDWEIVPDDFTATAAFIVVTGEFRLEDFGN